MITITTKTTTTITTADRWEGLPPAIAAISPIPGMGMDTDILFIDIFSPSIGINIIIYISTNLINLTYRTILILILNREYMSRRRTI